jgi:hypothetical protein
MLIRAHAAALLKQRGIDISVVATPTQCRFIDGCHPARCLGAGRTGPRLRVTCSGATRRSIKHATPYQTSRVIPGRILSGANASQPATPSSTSPTSKASRSRRRRVMSLIAPKLLRLVSSSGILLRMEPAFVGRSPAGAIADGAVGSQQRETGSKGSADLAFGGCPKDRRVA